MVRKGVYRGLTGCPAVARSRPRSGRCFLLPEPSNLPVPWGSIIRGSAVLLRKPFIKQCIRRLEKLYLPLNATVPSGAETAAAVAGGKRRRESLSAALANFTGTIPGARERRSRAGREAEPGGGRGRHAGGELPNGAAHARSGGARGRGPRPPRTCGSPRRAFPAGRPRPSPRHWLSGPARAGRGGAMAARRREHTSRT